MKKNIPVKEYLTSMIFSLACTSQVTFAHADGTAHSHATPILISLAVLLVLCISRVGLKKIKNKD